MLDRGELGGEGAPDLLGRRVRGDQYRVLLFERLQLPQPGVELVVGHGRRIEDVIAELRLTDLVSQFGMSAGGVARHIAVRDAGGGRLGAGDPVGVGTLAHRSRLRPTTDTGAVEAPRGSLIPIV